MKEIVYERYGSVDVLHQVEAPTPVPAAHQLRIAVKAVALNPLDWKLFEGQMKFVTGSKFPRKVGIEFAGIVAATGSAVTRFKQGDEVFGLLDAFQGGALAEEILVTEADLAAKPAKLSFAEAAALPIGGLSALQMLTELAPVEAGMEVLINGATGGVGMFATQLAKRRGARVTAAVSTRGVALAERWRADVVHDYRKESVLALSQRFDIVLDLSDKLPFAAARPLLKAKATYVNAMPNPKDIALGFFHNLLSRQQRKILMMKARPEALASLAKDASEWLEVVVGSTYPMASFKEAYAETRASGSLGKSVIVIG
jgi:NADPH:quinone reductase-like Zn-dependent oxidoreductase